MRIAKGLLLLLTAWIGLAAAFSGCTCVVNNYHYGTARPPSMFVANAPPPAKAETQTTAPSSDHVWIAGHWEWSVSEETWIWAAGAWALPPDDGATWVGPETEDNNGDWVYTPGHWRWGDPGSAEGEGTVTPTLPPADLHWEGRRPADEPKEDGKATPLKPTAPLAGPAAADAAGAALTAEAPEGAAAGAGRADTEKDEKAEPPASVAPGAASLIEDPYAEAEEDGGPIKRKREKRDKAELANPDRGTEAVQEKPRKPGPNTAADDGAKVRRGRRGADDAGRATAEPAKRRRGEAKATPEAEGDERAPSKAAKRPRKGRTASEKADAEAKPTRAADEERSEGDEAPRAIKAEKKTETRQ
jgi:hypothetical protein